MDVAQLLLDRNADPNTARTTDGSTPLYIASQNGHVDVAQLLLDRNADPNTARTNDGCTPLCIASQEGHVDVARLLLDRNADPNTARTNDGCTPLYIASKKATWTSHGCCLAATQTPTQQRPSGWTPLGVASHESHQQVVQLLAVHGASLTHADGSGHTAYDVATSRGHQQLADWLAAATAHAPIQIAVGCRLPADARSALRTGNLGDPTLCTVKAVLQAATSAPLWGAGVAMAPVCGATTQLARDAMACWSPERHWLFHARFRAAVHTFLLVRHRLEQEGSLLLSHLPHVPLELWFLVCGQLLRRHWAL